MSDIEEIKKEIVLRVLAENWLTADYIEALPKNDELRTLLCDLYPYYGYWYARLVDVGPHPETRKACCRDSFYAYQYALNVDLCVRGDTRESAYRDPTYREWYIEDVPY